MVAFVEVKQRRGLAFGSAGEAVGWRKRLRIGRVAAVWMDRHGKEGDVYRFDLMAVERRGIEHVADAWRMGWAPLLFRILFGISLVGVKV